jgi:RimJ/RimL family protein N-acetyltransferase
LIEDRVNKTEPELRLREVVPADLPVLFMQQLDPEANYMVAFTTKDPTDEGEFFDRWNKILADPTLTARSILYGDQLIGHIESFDQFGKPSVGYWLDRDFWGKGLATAALKAFLQLVTTRPLYARVAKDNIGSIRVLQKNGFVIAGEDKGFAHARGKQIEEYILKLDKSPD